MDRLLHDKITELEVKLRQLGFSKEFIKNSVEHLEMDAFQAVTNPLADEHLANYLRFLENKVDFVVREFIDRRKKQPLDELWLLRLESERERARRVAPTPGLADFIDAFLKESLSIK